MKLIALVIFAGAIALGAQALTPAQQATVDAAVDQLVQSGVITLPNGVTIAQAHTVGEVAMTAWLDHANYWAALADQLAALQTKEASDVAIALQQRGQLGQAIASDQAQLNALASVQAQIVAAECPSATGSGTTFQCGQSAVAAFTAALAQNETAIASLNASVATLKAQMAGLSSAAAPPPNPLPIAGRCAGITSGQTLALAFQATAGDQLVVFSASRSSTGPMVASSAAAGAGTAIPAVASAVGQSTTGTSLFYFPAAGADASYSILFPASCVACEACVEEYPPGSAVATNEAASLASLTTQWAVPAPAAIGGRLITIAAIGASGAEGGGWSPTSPASLVSSADALGVGLSDSLALAAAPGAAAISGSLANAHTWSGIAITLSLK